MEISLIMFREDGDKREIPLIPGNNIVGRKQDCVIRIPLSTVSRHHAQIAIDDHKALLKDLGSSNATFLNNKRVTTETELKPGDQIMIGPVIFTVRIDGQPNDNEIIEIRSKITRDHKAKGGVNVGTSKHVYISDEEIDPISALEALASSADQTAIDAGEENEFTD